MKLLDRYLGRRFVWTFLRAVLSLVALFILIDLLTHRRDNIIEYQIPAHVVAQYYLSLTPTVLFVYQAAALGVLASGLLVYGRAAQDNELLASFAGGISLLRLSVPAIIVAAAIAVGAFFAQETLGVRAAKATVDIERAYLSSFDAAERERISWTRLSGDWTAHVMKFNRAALSGENVFLHAIQEGQVQEIRARRIYWDPEAARWQLEDGRWVSFDTAEAAWQISVDRITRAPAPFTETPDQLFALTDPPATKTAAELARDLRRAESFGISVAGHWVEYHAKFARPALCFVMIWLAIPFAVRTRRGGVAVGFGLSVAIALTYLLVFYAGIGLGHIERVPPFWAAWLANATFFLAGLALFARSPR